MPAARRALAMEEQWRRSGLRLRLQATGFRTRGRLAGRRNSGTARRGRLDHRFACRTLAREQVLDLVAGQGLEFEQAFGEGLEIGALLLEDLLGFGIAGLDQALDLAVDLAACFLGDVLLARHLIAQEYLILVLAIGDGAERFREAPARHHHARELGGLLDVG